MHLKFLLKLNLVELMSLDVSLQDGVVVSEAHLPVMDYMVVDYVLLVGIFLHYDVLA